MSFCAAVRDCVLIHVMQCLPLLPHHARGLTIALPFTLEPRSDPTDGGSGSATLQRSLCAAPAITVIALSEATAESIGRSLL